MFVFIKHIFAKPHYGCLDVNGISYNYCKDNADERKESLLSISRVQFIFCKDNANRMQNKINENLSFIYFLY